MARQVRFVNRPHVILGATRSRVLVRIATTKGLIMRRMLLFAAMLASPLALAFPLTNGIAAPASRPVVKTAFNPILKKTILVDGKGRTLYMLTSDTNGVPMCAKIDPGCPKLWPMLGSTGKPIAGKGVNARLFAIVKGAYGKPQVSYNRHPLYLYSGDKKLGDVYGQGYFNIWYVLSPKGTPIKSGA